MTTIDRAREAPARARGSARRPVLLPSYVLRSSGVLLLASCGLCVSATAVP
jgi:hypothetical protein